MRESISSFGQISLYELQNYLKKSSEKNQQLIQRNTDIVQDPGTKICGHLHTSFHPQVSQQWYDISRCS